MDKNKRIEALKKELFNLVDGAEREEIQDELDRRSAQDFDKAVEELVDGEIETVVSEEFDDADLIDFLNEQDAGKSDKVLNFDFDKAKDRLRGIVDEARVHAEPVVDKGLGFVSQIKSKIEDKYADVKVKYVKEKAIRDTAKELEESDAFEVVDAVYDEDGKFEGYLLRPILLNTYLNQRKDRPVEERSAEMLFFTEDGETVTTVDYLVVTDLIDKYDYEHNVDPGVELHCTYGPRVRHITVDLDAYAPDEVYGINDLVSFIELAEDLHKNYQ